MTNEQTFGRIENFLQQNSPVNNSLMRDEALKDILQTDTDGNESVVPTEIVSRAQSKKQAR